MSGLKASHLGTYSPEQRTDLKIGHYKGNPERMTQSSPYKVWECCRQYRSMART